jgi:hypothetical protein
MDCSFNPDDMKTETENLGHKVANVWNITQNRTKLPLSLLFVDLKPAPNNRYEYSRTSATVLVPYRKHSTFPFCSQELLTTRPQRRSQSESESLYNWRSVSQYVLVSSPIWGLLTRDIYLLFIFFKLRSCLIWGALAYFLLHNIYKFSRTSQETQYISVL